MLQQRSGARCRNDFCVKCCHLMMLWLEPPALHSSSELNWILRGSYTLACRESSRTTPGRLIVQPN